MKVENILNDLNLKNKNAHNLLKQLQASAKKIQTSSGPRNTSQIILELIRDNLNTSQQKTLLTTWARLQLPLKEKQITQIINFINNNQDISAQTVIEAAGLLAQNNLLEKFPSIFQDLVTFLDNNNSLSKELFSLIEKEQTEEKTIDKNNSLQNIKNDSENTTLNQHNNNSKTSPQTNKLNTLLTKLFLSVNSPSEAIENDLKEYLSTLKETLTYFLENEIEDNEKYRNILKHFRGQQALNFQETDQQTKLLLFLELPLLFGDNQPPKPLNLQVFRQPPKKKSDRAISSYKLCFIIELEELGAIRAEVTIQNQTLKTHFYTDKQTTEKLIKDNFAVLKNKLNSLGYNVASPAVEHSTDNSFVSEIIINHNSHSQNDGDSDDYQSINFLI